MNPFVRQPQDEKHGYPDVRRDDISPLNWAASEISVALAKNDNCTEDKCKDGSKGIPFCPVLQFIEVPSLRDVRFAEPIVANRIPSQVINPVMPEQFNGPSRRAVPYKRRESK